MLLWVGRGISEIRKHVWLRLGGWCRFMFGSPKTLDWCFIFHAATSTSKKNYGLTLQIECFFFRVLESVS